jgi:hypothetical protein
MDPDDQPDLTEWVRARNAEDAALLERMYAWARSPEGLELGRVAALFVRQVAAGSGGIAAADASAAKAFTAVLDQHPAGEAGRTLDVVVDAVSGDRSDAVHRREAAELLATGSIAAGLMSVPDTGRIEVALHVSFGADGVSLLLRRVLTGRLDEWDPADPLRGLRDPLSRIDPRLDACLPGLRSAAGATARQVSGLLRIRGALPRASAEGISRLVPDRGSCGDLVAIEGTFPAAPPADTEIYFPSAGGRCWPASLRSWTTTRIEAWAPAQVGDGPVGFVTVPETGPGSTAGIDVGSAIEFAGALAACIGAGALRVADRLSTFVPQELLIETPCPPLLPGGANVFHGGPVLDRLSRVSAGERDAQPVAATGRNLRSGDTVEVDRVVVPTVFVDPTRLEFMPVAVPAGRRSVVIRRGACRSNSMAFDVTATVDPGPLPRVRPGDRVVVNGTGFARGQMSVLLNSESVLVDVDSPYQLEFRSFRPRRLPPARNPVGESVTVEVLHAGASIGTRTLTLDTFRIAVFGDSVVWGQGLTEPSKFTTLLADRMDRELGGSIGVYAVDRLAHSGAIVLPATGVLDPVPAPTPIAVGTGEVPRSLPSVAAQVAAWGATPALLAQAAQFEMVVLDGGANDVTIQVILDPLASDADLVAATRRACRGVLAGVLNAVRGTFSRATRIIVTGYYPIVSRRSDFDLVFDLTLGLGMLAPVLTSAVPGVPVFGWGPLGVALFKDWLVGRLAARSTLFADTANTALAETLAGTGDPRLALAVPRFGPENAIFAPETYLFGVGVGVGGLFPVDPVAAARLPGCAPGSITCPIASIGHPNPAGAQAYFEAISAVL